MGLSPALAFVPYPEVAEARNRILRFACQTEDAVGKPVSTWRTNVKCLHLRGPTGNGKTHILHALAGKYRRRFRTADDDYDPVWLIHAGDLAVQIAQLGGDWNSVADRYNGGSAFLIDNVEHLRNDTAARACLAQIARGFGEHGRPVVLTETTGAAPPADTTVLGTPELAWLCQKAESVSLGPPGELGIKLLVRHFARLHSHRLPLPVVEALAASVRGLDRPSVAACEQITMKLVAWCIFHDTEPSLDALAAMRSAALRSVGLLPHAAA